MELLGTFQNLTFMQVHDTVFVWVVDRWTRYCSLAYWLASKAGQHLRKIFLGGRVVRGPATKEGAYAGF